MYGSGLSTYHSDEPGEISGPVPSLSQDPCRMTVVDVLFKVTVYQQDRFIRVIGGID